MQDNYVWDTGFNKNSTECGVLPTSDLSLNRAKCKNSAKVYAATDTRKAVHVSLLLVAGKTKTL